MKYMKHMKRGGMEGWGEGGRGEGGSAPRENEGGRGK